VSRRKGSEWEAVWTDEKNENPFYIGHAGVESLQVVQDIDVDGKVEILSACAQSDVSPTLFRLFRWDGSKFDLVKKALITADKEDPTEFVWTDSKGDNSQVKCWILYFDETESGSGLKAFVTSTFNDKYKSGQALVRHSPKGFVVEKWIEPLKAQ
ncbi:MAG TPA: hypothetical protein PKO06_14845, partial [Candidatus Ozemobacteraceae bacterium]|nr:hypothetical protein [Candidatus Ozemobacteraceae bacterium]